MSHAIPIIRTTRSEHCFHYYLGRKAIGLPLILGAFASTARKLHKELQQLNVLDAGIARTLYAQQNYVMCALVLLCLPTGCGTGNYSKALSPFVESVTGLEYSKGMFEQARKKTEELGNVKLQQGVRWRLLDSRPWDPGGRNLHSPFIHACNY